MRIIAWNIAHQTREVELSPLLLPAIERLTPDVFSLNEYVHGNSRVQFAEGLKGLGFAHITVSKRVDTNNQVLIASRTPLEIGDIEPPSMGDGVSESNFLHVRLPTSGIEVAAIRVPAYESRTVLRDYWGKLAEIVRRTATRRILYVGDLNADPDDSTYVGAAHLAALKQEGWSIPRPSGPWSFLSGSRIDHVIASPALPIPTAVYVSDIDGVALVSQDRATRVSDHAALVVDLAL